MSRFVWVKSSCSWFLLSLEAFSPVLRGVFSGASRRFLRCVEAFSPVSLGVFSGASRRFLRCLEAFSPVSRGVFPGYSGFHSSVKSTCNVHVFGWVKALSHGAFFLATCNVILLLRDVKLANTCSITVSQYIFNVPNICHKFTSLKCRIALQVARKIAPCDRVLSYYCRLQVYPTEFFSLLIFARCSSLHPYLLIVAFFSLLLARSIHFQAFQCCLGKKTSNILYRKLCFVCLTTRTFPRDPQCPVLIP